MSLDKLCQIVGIPITVNPSTSQKELSDPRLVPHDGGIFSRSLTTPSLTPRSSIDGVPGFQRK
jgi:hypothetical protein